MTTATNDHFPVKQGDSTQPAKTLIAVTPSDVNELANVCRAFRVGTTAGDVEVVTLEDDTVIVPNVQVGERIDCWIKQIKAGNTTAVGITAYV